MCASKPKKCREGTLLSRDMSDIGGHFRGPSALFACNAVRSQMLSVQLRSCIYHCGTQSRLSAHLRDTLKSRYRVDTGQKSGRVKHRKMVPHVFITELLSHYDMRWSQILPVRIPYLRDTLKSRHRIDTGWVSNLIGK